MSNRARHHRRRRDRGPQLRGVAFVDAIEAARRVGGCGCPAVIRSTAELVIVEHHHRHGCPALDRWAS